METKKGIFQTQHSSSFSQYNDSKEVETYLKHPQNTPTDRLDENQQLGLKYSSDKSNQHTRFDNEYRVIRTPDINVIPSPHSFNNHYVQYQKSFQRPYYNTTQVTSASNLSHNLVVPNTPQMWIPEQSHYHPQPFQKSIPSAQQYSTKINNFEKRKINATSQLKSPIAKRPLEAPVTLQGWLHKQGSEGLMLWKKRWFVLSEYCLFYYKGPEEEKILGSILLPSYKVSLCRPDEKIGKKYAFKCEHANMRTYILAADSQELMKQWIYNLNLATMMQTNIEQKPYIHNTPAQQKIVDNNCQWPGGNYQKTPSSHLTFPPSNSILQDHGSFNQPLYANAPPKPRRLNDGLFPSSDISDRYILHYVDPGSLEKSPGANYSSVNYSSKNNREYVTFGGEFQANHDFERRTPDTYGRSKLSHPFSTDYEDVYSEQQTMYRRPVSPVGHSNIVKRNNLLPVIPIHRYYTPVNMVGPTKNIQCAAPQMRKNSDVNIVRPHSADFLEYELNHKLQDDLTPLKQRPRPKSSLEINANSTDNHNYFYSKERYAEKMRKSAQYLQNKPIKHNNEIIYNMNESITCPTHENTYPFVGRLQAHNHIPENNKIQVNDMHKSQPVRSKSVLSDDSISKEFSTDIDTKLFIECDSLSSDYMFGNCRSAEYDLITRSASARLPQTPSQVDRSSVDSIRSINRDRERKREESIRRLLEWKQRMLQSPLNRKIQGNVAYRAKNDIYNNRDNYKYCRNSKQSELYMDEDQSKSSTQYNSYSSDDEENEKRSKEIVQSQAGGILDNERPTPAQSTSTTTHITSADFVKPQCHLDLRETSYTNIFENLIVSYNQDDFSQHFKKFTKQDLEHIANLQLKHREKQDDLASRSYVELEGNKDTENSEENVEQPHNALEENYIPMSPNKNILISHSRHSECDMNLDKSKTDENHYVEMTKNVSGYLLDSSLNTKETEKSVVFNDNKTEPLYMELEILDQTTNNKILPDIILNPNKSTAAKSDSSDADDEASKDLDSLGTPNQPRFSLSDTFRPASYYLRTMQMNIVELQDSSDTELVSPLPIIPPSPQPLDDLSGGEYIKLVMKNDEKMEINTLSSSSISVNGRRFIKKKSSRPKSLNNIPLKGDKSISKICNSDTDEDTISNQQPVDYVKSNKCRPISKELCSDISNISCDTADNSTHFSSNSDNVNPSRFHQYENLMIPRFPDFPIEKSTNKSVEELMDFVGKQQIDRPRSSTSTSADISSLILNSHRSTPIVEVDVSSSVYSPNTLLQTLAPYYYSDLSINMTDSQSLPLTLNNQRNATKSNKRDIGHIKNPIKGNLRVSSYDNTSRLAAEARSASVDFLNLTDKPGHIDHKNIYESDSLQKSKSRHNSDEARNLLVKRKSNKFSSDITVFTKTRVRRSHSLEGLLENVLQKNSSFTNNMTENKVYVWREPENTSEGSYLWEEDSIWSEQLRSASQRHTKSMEDLDTIDTIKSLRGISRSVTYVNDNFRAPDKHKEHSKQDTQNTENKLKKEGSFIFDREKLRQWDLLSSAPSDNQITTTLATQLQEGNNILVDLTDANCDSSELKGNQNTASGSISINTRDASEVATRGTFPRVLSNEKVLTRTNFPSDSRSVITKNCDKEQNRKPDPKVYYSNLTPVRKENWPLHEKVSVSAGELLGRTHEELVLLLIQLRRQSTQTLQAIQNYYNEIDMIQAQLYAVNQARRMENLQKLEQIKQHLLELENQYEKGKPLVNLVDNMVKLGSLYRSPQDKTTVTPYIRDQLEFNQQIQERRLLAEEKREWSRLNTNHYQFQEKVQQLYILDRSILRLIHEESGALQNLQKDKEDIERALVDLRHRLSKGFKDPGEIEIAHKQQIMLENELSRVHYMLAQNSKKLEETVSGNARLEQELLVLKQKLQSSRQQSSPQYSHTGDSFKCTLGSNVTAESDLQKVERKIGELQKQRQKLSLQVRQLTDKSPNMSYQKSDFNDVQNDINKKRIHSLWRETDLDTMSIIDHGEYECNPGLKSIHLHNNAESKVEDYDFYNNADDSNTSMSVNLITPQEKQEIKTVRIVKRESEKRQRDKEKLIPSKWDVTLEEDDSSGNYNTISKPLPSSAEKGCNADKSNSIPTICDYPEQALSPDISPVFKSEAARQIITEMTNQNIPKLLNRRTVPKEKRRHYTAPHNHMLMKSLNRIPNDTDTFDKMNASSRRARDDLDMEIALRQRIDAPDVVRSTLINTELKYNERTIDDLLGIPNKINIPERYIPEQLPQFSAEEQEYRTKKAESIKKMLSETTLISTNSTNLSGENHEIQKTSNGESITTSKILDEKKQREHLLQLNQILAKQVMEMSKIVAERATSKVSNEESQISVEEEDLSPLTQLPLYQQRDNFYS
ncbi:uncharacterized protein LOC130893998 isoform X3 [Diorhabda carinulata]|nr:uncharacterized protein LOC130893998 isoform X3 [Diorhabda carinulata]XP_057656494.1 uncharacterized protein LOC130893998 isoform X3 [Diorhabda carinulata]